MAEVSIFSRDNIKPAASCSLIHPPKPYKLSFFDQLTPETYVPMLFFYPNASTHPNFNNLPHTLTHLKNSLSETLTLYYPIAGRTKHNLYIDDFDRGVPYLEAQVKCRMSEFLQLQQTELLDHFTPLHPFRKETDTMLPMLAIQVNLFTCGGVAIGVSFSHKIFDGHTANAFLKSWAAVSRGSHDKIISPNLSQATATFPPRNPMPQNYKALMDSMWFKEGKYVTRRFFFYAKTIVALQAKAKSENVPKPSRIETLTGFLWKYKMAASRALCKSTQMFVAAHAVNMRPRMDPKMSANTTGNLFWWSLAVADAVDDESTKTDYELCDLVNLVNESIKVFNSENSESLRGEEGSEVISELLGQIEEISVISTEIYAFTSWTGILDEVDFGWGTPYWIGVVGKVGPAFRNLTVFVEAQRGNYKGIEAWVTLDQKQMSILENDPEFLAFASLNPLIPTM